MEVTDEMVDAAERAALANEGASFRDDIRAGLEAAIGPHESIADLETTVREIRGRIEREIRDMLVEQTRTIAKMAENLSGSLGHSIALLAAINDRHDIDLPPMDSIVAAGRTAIQAWHEARPHIDSSLAALDGS